MPRGADSRSASPLALVPIAIVAAVMLALALFVSGNETGTIVVQRIALSARAIQNGQPNRPLAYSVTEITEATPNGTDERNFTNISLSRPDLQQVTAGQSIEVYDPRDDTIFVTTQAAVQRAIDAQLAPTRKGSHVGGRSSVSAHASVSARLQFVPGARSVFAQQLLAHQYRIAGRTTIAGRSALEIVQTHTTRLQGSSVPGVDESSTTAYVSPRTYDPIEEIIRIKVPGASSVVSERWTVYRVLQDTAANRRLLSLTALHPHARVVHSARGYVHATTFTGTVSSG